MRVVSGCLVIMAVAMPAEELHLTDGSVLVGTILPSSDDTRVDLQMRITGLEVIRHIERVRIASIATATDEVHERLSRLETRRAALQARRTATAEEWWELACEAHGAGEKALAEQWAWREVLGRDPDHADARASLGYIQVDGQWKTPGQLAMERGEVWHEGAWVPAEERDAAIEAARQAQSTESSRFAGQVAEQRQRAADARRVADAARTASSRATASSTTAAYATTSGYTAPYPYGYTTYRTWVYRPRYFWYGPVCDHGHFHHHGWSPVVWRVTFTRPITLLIPLSSAPMGGPPYRSGHAR